MSARILIVDDDELVRGALKVNLERHSYIVKTVGTGKDAIEIIKKESFNLALIDVFLSDMAGIQLLDVIEETDPRIIKLVFTGYHTPESEKKALERGADGYIRKPVSIEDLLTKIEELLNKQDEETNNREE